MGNILSSSEQSEQHGDDDEINNTTNIPTEEQLTIFRTGSDKEIKEFLATLDLDNEEVLKELFYASAIYGRLNWLQHAHATIKEKEMDIRKTIDDAFINATENGYLEVLKWLWIEYGKSNLYDAPINSNIRRTAYRISGDEGYGDIQEWLAKIDPNLY